MKIKLKDMTEEQYSKWKKEKCRLITCKDCIFCKVFCTRDPKSWVCNKNLYSDEFLNQEIEIEDEEILTDEEKKYLEAVIRPFRYRVRYIGKIITSSREKEFVYIDMDIEKLILPNFEVDKYYKGMELNKLYTLEELGLFDKEQLLS